ncbi:MAG: outer membrane protein transport protein [Bacteroidales bacterium]|nr:outer membrane protein transport protein [Bacteroidales bacterium]
MLNKLRISLFLLIVTIGQVTAQKMVNSPYARFGPGTLEPAGLFKSLSMGGAATALRDPLTINFVNPASYAGVDTNSFVFDFGLDYRMIALSDGENRELSDDFNFHHVVMSFPLTKRSGFAFGLVPYSSGYYNISAETLPGDADYDPLIGETVNIHKGTGSFNKFFAGAAVAPVKNLSIGVNIEFLFGSIERSNNFLFNSGTNYYNNRTSETILLRGHNFVYGLQYGINLSETRMLTAGVTYSAGKDYKADYESLAARYSLYTGSFYSTDTLSYEGGTEAILTLPQQLSFGINYTVTDRLTILADYTTTKWSEAQFPGYDQYLTDRNSINAGISFIPDKTSNSRFLDRVEYRLGGHTAKSHLVVNGEQLKEFGITFGAGLPMNRSKSMINLFLGYGTRKGSFENDLHNETYFNFGLSFNFYDNWFEKRKYN